MFKAVLMIKDERTSRLVVIVYSEDFQRTGKRFCFFFFIYSLSEPQQTDENKPPRCIMWHRFGLNHISLRQIESKINVPASSC